MKKPFFTFCALIFSAYCHAQSELDSLLLIAESSVAADTAVINSLNDYTTKHYRSYPEITKRISEKVLAAAEKIGYKEGQAIALRKIGAANYVLGRSAELIDSQLKAIALFEELGDSSRAAGSWNNIGLAYLQTGDFEKAGETFSNALKSVDPADYGFTAVLYNNLGIVHDRLDQPDSSLYYHSRALEIRLEFNVSKRRLQATYTNLGSLYRTHVKNLDKAIEFTQKAISINHEIKNFVGLGGNYINLGNMYEDRESWSAARESYRKAIQYADSSKNQSTLSAAYRSAAELEEELGNPIEALKFFKQRHDARIQAIENRQEVEIKRLENNYTVAQKEKELAVLKTEQAEQELVQLYLITGIIIAVLTLFVIILIARARIKKAKEGQLKLEQELEYKNKELTSYALNFIQKNELIERFSDRIEEIKKQAGGELVFELNKVRKLLDDSFRIDNEWENFKMRFEEVHKGFFTAIKSHYPEIGSAELRLCALLRLNMNLKESSRILGISTDSVKTARYRLRKKLGLTTDDNLVDFLIRFDQKMVA